MNLLELAVVHHRTPSILANHLEAVRTFAPSLPIRVLDTGPTEGPEAHAVRAVVDAFPGVRLHRLPNHSYAAAVNTALHLAGEPGSRDGILIVANADAFLGKDTVPALLAPFRAPDVAMTGPLGRTPEGSLHDHGILYGRSMQRVVGRGPRESVQVPWLSGFLFAVRLSAAHAVGGMDASFRFTNEDMDMGLRLRARGWRNVLVGAEVVHLGGSSTPDHDAFLVEGLRGGLAVTRRHYGPVVAGAHRALGFLWAAARARTAQKPRRVTWQAVQRMMATGRIGVSPFGTTLNEMVDGFPDRWPPVSPSRGRASS